MTSTRASGTLLLLAFLAVFSPVKGAPTLLTPRNTTSTTTATPNTIQNQNGLDAQKLNVQFAALKATDACTDGEMACITNSFAQCVAGKWALTPCASGTQCVALPLVNKPGTSLACDTQADALARFTAASVQGGLTGIASNTGTGNTTNTTPTGTGNTTNTTPTDNGDDCEEADGGVDESTEVGNDDDCADDGTTTDPSGSSTSASAPNPSSTIQNSPQVITVTVTATPTPIAKSAGSTTILLNAGTTASAPPSISSSTGGYAGYKRQLVSANPSSVVSSAPTVTVTMTPSSVAVPTVTITPSTQVNVPTSVSGPSSVSSGGVEPTSIVIGADGIRTVTVVSTVTVGCGASTVSPTASPTVAFPSPSSVSSNSPIFTTVTTIATPGSTVLSSSATIPLSSVVVQSSSVPVSSPSGFSFSTASSTGTVSSAISTASSATASSTPSTNRGGFSFSTAPSPTPAPQGGVNNGSGTSFNLSDLITATVSA